eukprot:RCo036583
MSRAFRVTADFYCCAAVLTVAPFWHTSSTRGSVLGCSKDVCQFFLPHALSSFFRFPPCSSLPPLFNRALSVATPLDCLSLLCPRPLSFHPLPTQLSGYVCWGAVLQASIPQLSGIIFRLVLFWGCEIRSCRKGILEVA